MTNVIPLASRSAAPTPPNLGTTPDRINPVAFYGEAVNACAMATYYARKGNYAGATRKMAQAMVALRRLEGVA